MGATGKHIDVFPQNLKGLCIILVVLIHLPWGQDGEWSAWLWISIRKIINFAVATFFFLSAYYTKSYEDLVKNGIAYYYKKRLKRLLIPYTFWATVYIICIPLLTTGKISDNWIYFYLTGKGPTYFLLALTQFTIINPLLQKYKNNKICNIIFWSITPTYLILYYWYNIKTGTEFKPEQFFCFPWFACYYLGLKLQETSFRAKLNKIPSLILFATCLVLLIFSLVESTFIYSSTGIFSFSISQITFGSILYSIAILILFQSFWNDLSSNKRYIFTAIGDFSMGIFLMHPLFNWIFKFIGIHLPGGTILYTHELGFMVMHIIILMLSVTASYYTARQLSIKFPVLIKPLGLK